MRIRSVIWRKNLPVLLVIALLALTETALYAQPGRFVKQLKISNNQMTILLSRNIPVRSLDSFTLQYNVAGLGLHQLVLTGKKDSLEEMGWIVSGEQNLYTVRKKMGSGDKPLNPADKIIFSAVPTPDDWRVVGGNRVVYGANRFSEGREFKRIGNVVYFTLKGYQSARRVRLAGSFTNWQHNAFPMTKTNGGWTVPVKLEPGQYFYKFIIDEDEWTTDPDNDLSENDGQGNENSVFFVPSKTFFLKGYPNAKNVLLTGSFNNWAKTDNDGMLQLKKAPQGWMLDMYLEPGTHTYRFIVDGKTVTGNEPAGENSRSVVAMGNAHMFTLNGYPGAKTVSVAGNFNDWEPDQIYLERTANGWKLPYVLGPGNYQYKFIVDGRWITDPVNPAVVDDGKGNENSFLVIGANHTFRLKGYPAARTINLAGDFNGWSEKGLPMKWNGTEWVCAVYLARGKHLYKFIVDGKWILDPANKLWEENELGTGNSVIWIE